MKKNLFVRDFVYKEIKKYVSKSMWVQNIGTLVQLFNSEIGCIFCSTSKKSYKNILLCIFNFLFM